MSAVFVLFITNKSTVYQHYKGYNKTNHYELAKNKCICMVSLRMIKFTRFEYTRK